MSSIAHTDSESFSLTNDSNGSSMSRQITAESQSPSVVRNPSPPPIDNLSRADMVGDEMYSKSWFCRVLLKLIQFVAPQQIHDEIFAIIREQGEDYHLSETNQTQELDETFESELCELWDVSMSADVAHLLIEFNALDLFNLVLIESKDKRCTEIVLGILSNMACCKRNFQEKTVNKSVALHIIEHTNLFSTILNLLTSDDYSDCPSLVQLYRLIYTLIVRQDTRTFMFEHIQCTFEPLCFIFQSCCNRDLLEQCSCLLRVLFDECNLFSTNEQVEVAYLFLTSITTALSALIDSENFSQIFENLFNCLQIYTTYEHCVTMLNDHCEIIMKLIEKILNRLVHDDVIQLQSVLLLSIISISNYFLDKNGLKIINNKLLEYFLLIGYACYKDRQRRDHDKHSTKRSRTHSHSKQQQDSDDKQIELNRSTSEDLSATCYSLVDELFLEMFYRGIKDNSDLFRQLTQDQRENFRKIIKHFCNLERRLDELLDL